MNNNFIHFGGKRRGALMHSDLMPPEAKFTINAQMIAALGCGKGATKLNLINEIIGFGFLLHNWIFMCKNAFFSVNSKSRKGTKEILKPTVTAYYLQSAYSSPPRHWKCPIDSSIISSSFTTHNQLKTENSIGWNVWLSDFTCFFLFFYFYSLTWQRSHSFSLSSSK